MKLKINPSKTGKVISSSNAFCFIESAGVPTLQNDVFFLGFCFSLQANAGIVPYLRS